MNLIPIGPGKPSRLDVPGGWYVMAFSRELGRGAVVSRTLGGHPIVLFRTGGGELSALDGWCPHLGAALGDGRVVGEHLRCPMHGFCFDTKGRCVSTPYEGARPPPRARSRNWPVQERSGAVFVYLDETGAEPSWEVPELEQAGWSPLVSRVLTFPGHPQEICENSVDRGHFQPVHGYESVSMEVLPAQGRIFIRASRRCVREG